MAAFSFVRTWCTMTTIPYMATDWLTKMCTRKPQRRFICWGVVSTILIVLGVISIPVLNVIVKQQIIKNVMLVEGSQVYSQWKSPTIPIFVDVFVFDLQNPKETAKGAKPSLKQKGPYRYREHRKKVDIQHNKNGTVSYRQIVSYVFVQEGSVGPDTDTFTTVNIPLVAFGAGIRWEPKLIQKLASFLMTLAVEELFITRTIAEMVWGYQDPLLTLGKDIMPNWFSTDIVGAMAGRNATDDGVYTVFTGEEDIHKVGIINRYKGSKYLPFWNTPYANMINGTDGSLAPPFLDKNEVRYMFASDVCRSAFAIYNGTMKTSQGIDLYRFVAPRKLMLAPPYNPDNAAFCVPPGDCLVSGALNITPCMTEDHFSIPLILSFPHFYLADPSYREAVDGMHPDGKQHNMYLGIEPKTGIVMELAKRLQVNVNILNEPSIRQLAQVSSVVYPLLWVNESASIDDANARKLWLMFLLPVQIAHIFQYLLIVFGAVILLCLIGNLLYIYLAERKGRLEREAINSVIASTPSSPSNLSERSPLLGSQERS